MSALTMGRWRNQKKSLTRSRSCSKRGWCMIRIEVLCLLVTFYVRLGTQNLCWGKLWLSILNSNTVSNVTIEHSFKFSNKRNIQIGISVCWCPTFPQEPLLFVRKFQNLIQSIQPSSILHHKQKSQKPQPQNRKNHTPTYIDTLIPPLPNHHNGWKLSLRHSKPPHPKEADRRLVKRRWKEGY